MNKAMKIGMLAAVAVGTLAAVAADVKKSSIQPAWSGAKVATWTMDYEAALANAKADGKYTLMMFSGMWWCPHCQHFEENVLKTSEWKNYAKANGFYETVLDFPNRTGDGYWCWLWDSGFRRKAGLTAEDAAAEIIKRYGVQNDYSIAGAIYQTAKNMVVSGTFGNAVMTPYEEQPTSEYSRVGYPTIIVLNHDGKEVGRFSPVKTNAEYMEDPLGWTKAKINSMLYPGAGEMITDAGQYSGMLLDNGKLVGTVTCKAAKPNKNTNFATLTFAFVPNSGKKTSIKATVYSAENVTASVTDKSGNALSFSLGLEEIYGTFNGYEFRLFRDVFAEDLEAIARLSEMWGNSSLVVTGAFDYAKGCKSCGTYEEGVASRALLTVAIGAKGKAKITGATSAGTKVSVSAQLSYASNGELYLPIADKKSGMSFVLLIDADNVAHMAFASNGETLVAFGRPAESLTDPLYFSCENGTSAKLTVENGKTLKASDLSMKLTYTSKSGVCKGSYKNAFNTSVSVNGVFVGATGYMTATPRGGDSLEAFISSEKPKDFSEECDACHD